MRVSLEIFLIFLRLGLTSFGGPVAHLSYFRTEFVGRRAWLSETAYADIVALCQFLPGPASSQVGLAVGLSRGGLLGGLAAWLGFTLPSALALTAFALGLRGMGDLGQAGWLHGLKLVAVAVVAQAVWSMARGLCPDARRQSIAVGACILALSIPSTLGQLTAILLGAISGWWLLPGDSSPSEPLAVSLPRWQSWSALGLFILLLLGLPLIDQPQVQLFDSFYRAGALVFGGGHVVLPLLQAELIPSGLMDGGSFLAGYGAAQAVPGPLFTFAAYLGAVMGGPSGALLCLIAIFLPGALLVIGLLPFWSLLRPRPAVQSALKGVNAAVVGLLLAALYTPVWAAAVQGPKDFALIAAALLGLMAWKLPPWAVVLAGAFVSSLF